MTQSGIENATCRFVAWCLNYYVTASPLPTGGVSVKFEGGDFYGTGVLISP